MGRFPKTDISRRRHWWPSGRMVWLAPLIGWMVLMTLLGALFAWRFTRLPGAILEVRLVETADLMVVVGAVTVMFVVIWRTLALHQEDTGRLGQLAEFNALLAEINQAIAQAEDDQGLLQAFCDLAVRRARFKLAWVGRPDADGVVRFLASAGAMGYLDGPLMISTRPDLPEGQGPAGRAWRSGEPVYDPATWKNPALSPWAERARRFGLRSSGVVPVYRDHVPWALLAVYHSDKDVFDHDLRMLLEEMAKDLGHGLVRIDLLHRERSATAELARQAGYDALTGLPNRRALDAELDKAMARAVRMNRLLVVAMLDVDGFKAVNDTYGHQAGDLVLQTVGHRLRNSLRKTDFIARFGGDEFVFLIDDAADTSMDVLESVFTKIEHAVREPIVLADRTAIAVGVSMGACLYPFSDEHRPAALLRYADHALYLSKAHQADRAHAWVWHGVNVRLRRNAYQDLLAQEEGVEVLYQPIVDGCGQIVGIEALARLRGADGRLIDPEDFLPQLTTENKTDLSERILTRGLADLTALDALGGPLWITFNVAPESFHGDFIPRLMEIIGASGIDPSRITVEILEGGDFLERDAAVSILHDLKDRGIRLALDDIGSAYSSLLRLKELPIDKIKLDQGFVRAIEQRPQDLHFVSAIQALATELQVDLVVEGVESADILDAMITMGIPYLQGYAISRPLPLEDLQGMLRAHAPGPLSCPKGLFGSYAAALAFHGTLRKMLRANPAELDREALSDVRRCKGYGMLDRLGHGDDSRLGQLHDAYHRALGEAAHSGGGSRGSPEWDAAEVAFAEFTEALLAEWQKERSR